jgi:hypothetical protein
MSLISDIDTGRDVQAVMDSLACADDGRLNCLNLGSEAVNQTGTGEDFADLDFLLDDALHDPNESSGYQPTVLNHDTASTKTSPNDQNSKDNGEAVITADPSFQISRTATPSMERSNTVIPSIEIPNTVTRSTEALKVSTLNSETPNIEAPNSERFDGGAADYNRVNSGKQISKPVQLKASKIPRHGQQATGSASQLAHQASDPDHMYTLLRSRRTHCSDRTAREAIQKNKKINENEQRRRFLLLTGRAVITAEGTMAFARGYYPSRVLEYYASHHLPQCNPSNQNDSTTYVNSPFGLSENNATNLPLAVGWIEDARIPLPRSPCRGNIIRNAYGYPMTGATGTPLRDFKKILPDRISSQVEGWRMQYWFTIDPRITFDDIMARMPFHFNQPSITNMASQLDQRVKQFRSSSGILEPLTAPFDWDTYQVTLDDMLVICRMTRAQLEYGTWWAIDEAQGVMYPPFGPEAGPSFRKERYVLPVFPGKSPRVEKILEACQLQALPLNSAPSTASPVAPAPAPSAPQVPQQVPACQPFPPHPHVAPAAGVQRGPRVAPSKPRKRPTALESGGSNTQKRVRTGSLTDMGVPEVDFPRQGMGMQRQYEALMKKRG